MIPSRDPTTTWLDPGTGLLTPNAELAERRVADMRGYYIDDDGADRDRLVYRVYSIPAEEASTELQCSTTILEPGLVGSEFHMTKGHFHAQRDRAEVYVGLAGDGVLLLATEDGRHLVQPIRAGSVSYVPGGWAHRSVNVGTDPLIFFAVYIGDAGHDYGTIAERGFPVLVVRDGEGHRVVRNPRYRG